MILKALLFSEMFNEKIYAWRHGPVCEEIYHEYKSNGSKSIDSSMIQADWNIFSDEQKNVITDVYLTFGQFSAWKLRDMTHEEPTWISNEQEASEITHDEMKDYFKTRIA